MEKNNEIFFSIMEQSNDIILICSTKDQEIIHANKKAIATFKYSKEELLEKKYTDLKSTLSKIKEINYKNYKNFQDENYEILIDKNNTEIYVEYSKQKIDDFTIYSAKNCSCYIQINEKLEQYNKKLQDEVLNKTTDLNNQTIFLNTLINNAPTAIFYKDVEGKYLGCNKAWENLTGLKEKDVLNKNVYDIAPLDIANIYATQDEKVFSLEESPQIYETQVFNNKKNELRNVVFYKSAYFDTNNDVHGLIGVVVDITDITTLEKETNQKEKIIYHQSKMAAMGEMIENIAHQWRQPLSMISTSASGIKMQKEYAILTDDALNDSIDSIVDSAQHLSKTIDDFRDFFKPNKERKSFNIKRLSKRALSLLSSKFKNKDIDVITDIEDVTVFGLENELIHVLMNILNNAQDALMHLSEVQKLILIQAYSKDDYLIITVQDSAGGIPEKIIDRIFEPYFTTKHQKQGTGIGLYMTEEIIKKHMNGYVTVKNKSFTFENNKHYGAKFIIKIPI